MMRRVLFRMMIMIGHEHRNMHFQGGNVRYYGDASPVDGLLTLYEMARHFARIFCSSAVKYI